MPRQIKRSIIIGLMALAVAFGAASGLAQGPSAPVQLATDPGVHGGGTGG